MNDLKLDWLSFTYVAPLEDLELLGLSFTPIDSFMDAFPELSVLWDSCDYLDGFNFYKKSILYRPMTVRFSYNEDDGYSIYNNTSKRVDMGVNVSVPSHALEWFFGLFDIDINRDTCIKELFDLLTERHCHASRIDLAYDDYGMRFMPNDYVRWFYEHRISTRFRRYRLEASEAERGWTFYLGSRSCGKMLRIYDKDYESDGAIKSVRYEFEHHGNHAKDIWEYLRRNTGVDFFGYLLSYMRVVIPSNNTTNITYIPSLPEWVEYFTVPLESVVPDKYVPCADESVKYRFNEVFPLKIPQYTEIQRYKSIVGWFFNACLNTCTGVYYSFGPDGFAELMRSNKSNIPDKFNPYLHKLRGFDFIDFIN